MSTESLIRRLRDAGITDLSPEGLLKRARESGDPYSIKEAEEHVRRHREYEKKLKAALKEDGLKMTLGKIVADGIQEKARLIGMEYPESEAKYDAISIDYGMSTAEQVWQYFQKRVGKFIEEESAELG